MLTTNPITHLPIKPNPFLTSLSSSSFASLYRKNNKISVCKRLGLFMSERGFRLSALGSQDDDDDDDQVKDISVLEQETLVDGSHLNNFEATINRLSKWLVAALFGAVILYRHDSEVIWASMGSVINTALSVILKRIFNQERPFSNLRSDPGMPSSHAQSIFYLVTFFIISTVEWLGVNELTLAFATASLVFGSYLSWLRVTQQLHTVSQVTVGAVLGSCFSLVWLWSWDAFFFDAFNSSMWVRLSILLCSAILVLGFLWYIIRNWFSDE